MLYIFFVDLSLKGDEDIIMISQFPPLYLPNISTYGLNLLLLWKSIYNYLCNRCLSPLKL